MTIENLTYDEPQGRDVLVKMVATGLCHSDLHVLASRYDPQHLHVDPKAAKRSLFRVYFPGESARTSICVAQLW
jgi:acyl dehydratase